MTPKLLVTPTQALTTQFKIDENGDGGRHGQKQAMTDKSYHFVGGEARQGFRISELRFMIRYEDGSELTEIPIIHRLPNAPTWFCGIANLHGKLIPVFDLAHYIGIDPDQESKRMLLVLSRGADATGILIDGLPERLRWSDNNRTDVGAAPKTLLPHLHGISLIGEYLWFDLNTHSLLGAIEKSLETQ
jgi:chemotaxis signal transduction protein